jgi:hypothetical protein
MRLNALHRLGRFDEAQSTIDYAIAIAIAIAAATFSTTCRTARGDRTGRTSVRCRGGRCEPRAQCGP